MCLCVLFPVTCDAAKPNGACCKLTVLGPCGLYEGDCDTDAECDVNLYCGSDNCLATDSRWPSNNEYDCCIGSCVLNFVVVVVNVFNSRVTRAQKE